MFRSLFPLALLALALLVMATDAAGQASPFETGGIVGFVSDSAGGRIAGAQLSILGVRGRAETGPDGSFRMSGVPAGSQILLARRIGFRPESLAVSVRQGIIADVAVQMRATPQQLRPVVVDGGRARPVGRLRAFEERRARGHGHFFTAADIDRRNPSFVTDLLRSLPGVRVNRINGQNVVTFRGQRCPPLIWLDGAPATAGYLDPDIFTPSSLAGIEVYLGPSTVPPELMWVRGKGACGVIVLWSRMSEAGARPRNRVVTAQDLANLITNLKLYTADQVDSPASPDSANPVAPLYPDSLLRAGASGRAVVEFVVDTAGVPDMDTFGTIAATHPLFAEAVRRAVAVARFTPAVLAGARVRQLVQLPITFAMPASGRPGVNELAGLASGDPTLSSAPSRPLLRR